MRLPPDHAARYEARRKWRKDWYTKRRASGLCTQCGNPRVSGWFCAPCLLKQRLRSRARFGSQPWQPGARGRVPLVPEVEVTP